jgi:ubiquinone/menaquinone biosynthesis C-methylase UbiE
MSKIDEMLSKILVDPVTREPLVTVHSKDQIISEIKNQSGQSYPINNGVIDFENDTNYADNFGDQWSRFPKLQLDSFNGTKISEKRFFKALNLETDELEGKLILDVGCGTGRFAEIALKAGAYVVGLDYSSAAYVASKNLEKYSNFRAIRGDIYKLPFKEKSFDIVYCLGVLQHTPNVEQAFKSLPLVVKNSGYLVVDYYWKRLKSVLGWKYTIRLITSYLKESTVLKILSLIHPFVYPISRFVIRTPFIGKALSRLLPVVNYCRDYPELGDELLREWSFLDTYDNWAPKYDQPQTVNTVKKWALDASLKKVSCEHAGHLVVRGFVE